MQLGAILDEIEFAQGDRVDPGTSARVGRLIQAGRMVQGLAVIPPGETVRLEASVVLSTGEVTAPASATGDLEDLLTLEKEVVVGIAANLGYQLSQAERTLILENGTQNLVAFLAYANGLVAEDAGDYSAAATFYAQAVQADPGFDAARSGYETTAVAATVEEAAPGEIVEVATEEAEEPEEVAAEAPATEAAATTTPTTTTTTDATENAVASTVGDIAATTSEQTSTTSGSDEQATGQTTGQATDTSASDPPPTATNEGTTETVTGTVRIVFRLP